MPTPLPSGKYRSEHADLAESEFVDTNLQRATFRDVNLRASEFEDVALTGSTIRNACLGDVSIVDANYTGMRIEGVLVTDLLRAYREYRGAEAGARPDGPARDS